MTKHFFKVLTIFSVMIIFGLVGVFILNFIDKGSVEATNKDGETQVAK